MALEQRRQAVLQLHLNDEQVYCLLPYVATYIRGLTATNKEIILRERGLTANVRTRTCMAF